MRGTRNGLITILTTFLVAGSTVAIAAQGEAPEPVGFGGQIEVPEAGFAISLPDDWVHVRPQASDVDTILENVRAIAPDLVAAVEPGLGAFSVSLLGYAPSLPGSFAENCNVVSAPTQGLSLAFIVQANLGQMNALGWESTEPTLHELAAGVVAQLDYEVTLGNQAFQGALWIYSDGETQLNLTCMGIQPPEDAWLSIAETVEFLPTE